MPFDIDDAETEQLVRQLAKRRGVSAEEAVRTALRNELQRNGETTTLWERLQPLLDRVNARGSTGLEADKAFYDSLYDE